MSEYYPHITEVKIHGHDIYLDGQRFEGWLQSKPTIEPLDDGTIVLRMGVICEKVEILPVGALLPVELRGQDEARSA
ncbi:hypothetical protein NSA19_01020 [Actinomyces bowdenii]|uniref:hypothetical protein n=1 Tax=Actinomyces bowdenii TaxID=131109 RepID=UPI00214A9CC9|nr:hypothetical protein [Actinomyces bowdenii]MCR2051458.1 hypothetical protein [Actinomyces bowdenii]